MSLLRHVPGLLLKPLLLLLTAAGVCAMARAQDAADGGGHGSHAKPAPALGSYFDALSKRHLLPPETAKAEELHKLLVDGEHAGQAGHYEEAALLLFEVVESPRFADYAAEADMDAARYALGTALYQLGAQQSARTYLRAIIEAGPDASYFAPAFRRHTDVALAGLPLDAVIADLGKLNMALPEDAQNELRYLRGRERELAGDDALAMRAYGEITPHSRFYANAQYLLGAIASRHGQLNEAEAHFCKIATAGDDRRYSFYVDDRYFAVKDLARLGLGRVAHEQGRADDAFYYYFQVPQDSPRLPEAMFEGAYASYEGGDHETATDLLDQLQARFPRSAFADEASILRGYVSLQACDFDRANKLFSLFIQRFTPALEEADRILRSASRRDAVYAELERAAQDARDAGDANKPLDSKADSDAAAGSSSAGKRGSVRATLLALLGVDPVFQELHARITQLDAEAARAGRLPEVVASLAARMSGSDAPKPVADATPSELTQLQELQRQLDEAKQATRLLTQQLDTMRRLKAAAAELSPLENSLRIVERKLSDAQSHLQDARWSLSPKELATPRDAEIAALFKRDLELARGFDARVAALRPKLVAAANDRALSGLRSLRERLADFLRRARIGRIDAVMGSKRRIEIQIESLAAGRFPAELRDPLLVQGFLNDDEEYWPFEGEDWPDEYLEHYDAAHAADGESTDVPTNAGGAASVSAAASAGTHKELP